MRLSALHFWIIELAVVSVWCFCPAVARTAPSGSSSTFEGTLVEGKAAEVGGTPILVGDVLRIIGVSKSLEGKANPTQVPSQAEFGEALQSLVLQEMVLLEMKALNVSGVDASVTEKDVKKALKTKKVRDSWLQTLGVFSLSESDAMKILVRRSQVEKFIAQKMETLKPAVTKDLVDAYLQRNSALGSASDPAVLARVERLVKKERAESDLRDWILLLRKKYSVVQYFGSAPENVGSAGKGESE